jgi:predicted helicase
MTVNVDTSFDIDIEVDEIWDEIEDRIESKIQEVVEVDYLDQVHETVKDALSDEFNQKSPLATFINNLITAQLIERTQQPDAKYAGSEAVHGNTLDSIVEFLSDVGYPKVAEEVKEAYEVVKTEAGVF